MYLQKKNPVKINTDDKINKKQKKTHEWTSGQSNLKSKQFVCINKERERMIEITKPPFQKKITFYLQQQPKNQINILALRTNGQ